MDGNDDDDLQAALALSMQPSTSNDNNNSNNIPTSMKRSNMDTSPSQNNTNNYNSSSNEFNCKSFHKLMWNDNTTTTNDKERWLYECISTPSLSNNYNNSNNSEESMPSKSAAAAMGTENIMVDSNDKEQSSDLTTPLQIFTNSTTSTTTSSTSTPTSKQPIWGLTQKHGGPCGVLASIQAELIRILLFGRGIPSPSNGTAGRGGEDGTYSNGGSDGYKGISYGNKGISKGGGELYYPFVPKANMNYVNCVSAPICDYEGTSFNVCWRTMNRLCKSQEVPIIFCSVVDLVLLWRMEVS